MLVMDVEVDVNSSDNMVAFEVDSIINYLDYWFFFGHKQHMKLDLLLQGLRTLVHLICDDGKRTDQEDFFLVIFKLQILLVLVDTRF